MRNLEDFYVKNTSEYTQIYVKLKPVIFPENDFTYEGLKVISRNGETEKEERQFTYKDILRMYEDGFYTIERDEFERAEALASLQMETVGD